MFWEVCSQRLQLYFVYSMLSKSFADRKKEKASKQQHMLTAKIVASVNLAWDQFVVEQHVLLAMKVAMEIIC